MATPVGSLRATLELESAAFIRELRRASTETARNTAAMSRSVKNMQAGFARAGSAIKGAIAGYVSIQSVRMVANFARNALNAAAAVKETADALGIASSKLQAYQIAGEQVGITSGQMEKSLGFFVRVVGQAKEGLGPLQAGLKETNPALLENVKNATSAAEAVDLMLDAIKAAPNIFEKNRLAALGFGKGAKEMALLAAESSREARQRFIDLGLTVDDALGGKLDKIMDDFALMQRAVQAGFATGFIKTFNANLGGTGDHLKTISDASAKFGEIAAKAVTSAGNAFKWAMENADLLKAAIVGIVALKLAAWATAAATAVTGLAAAFGGASAAINTFKTAMARLGPIGLLVAAMIDVEQKSQALVAESERVKKANEEAGHSAEGLAKSTGVAANAITIVSKSASKVAPQLGTATNALFSYTGALNALPNVGPTNTQNADSITMVGTSASGTTTKLGAYTTAFRAFFDSVSDASAASTASANSISAVGTQAGTAVTKVLSYVDAVKAVPNVSTANMLNANSISMVGTAAITAAGDLKLYAAALNAIPNAGSLGIGPTSEADLFAQMGQMPEGGQTNPWQAAQDGLKAVGAAAAETTPQVNALNDSLAAAGQQGETMGSMHQMTASQVTMGWLNVAETVAGAFGTLFKDNKAVAIAMAVINTAQAITAALAQYPPPLSFAMAAAQAAAGAAQIATIASTRPGSSKAPSMRGGSGGGGQGKGGGGGAVASAGVSSQLRQTIVLQVTGESFGPEHFKKLVAGLNGVIADGAVLRVA